MNVSCNLQVQSQIQVEVQVYFGTRSQSTIQINVHCNNMCRKGSDFTIQNLENTKKLLCMFTIIGLQHSDRKQDSNTTTVLQ